MTTQYHKNDDGELILDEDGDPIPDHICLCHAYEASECICGAWDSDPPWEEDF